MSEPHIRDYASESRPTWREGERPLTFWVMEDGEIKVTGGTPGLRPGDPDPPVQEPSDTTTL